MPDTVASGRWSFGPWLFSARSDLALFVGTALFALTLVAARHVTGLAPTGELPEWGFIAFVLLVDVAHVYATLFRTYFDPEEIRANPLRYYGLPLVVYVGLVALYRADTVLFWRVLAYAALFHFIRQQVGWVAVYRARSGRSSRLEAWLDSSTVYAITLYPVVHWHAHLDETRFAWLVNGDFAAVAWAEAWVDPLGVFAAVLLSAFVLRELALAVTTRVLQTGKLVVVLTTASLWYVGIVATNSDFDFTVTNVLAHGLPYVVLVWFYANERCVERPRAFGSSIVVRGVLAFVGVLALLAFAEEALWDRLVFHDRSWLFGSGADLGPRFHAWLVPLLALPQAVHYVLDGVLWRRSETRRLPAQQAALGFSGREPAV